MWRLSRSILLACALTIAPVALAQQQPMPMPMPSMGRMGSPSDVPTLAPLVRKVVPGVVSIAVSGRVAVPPNPLSDPFFRHFFGVPEGLPSERQFQAAGSGVIIDAKNGYILTNNHVIENADQITVLLGDGRRFKAQRIGTDPATDLAVLQIKAEGLTALNLGDSSRLQVGDFVVAVGNPFGLGQTVTIGIVSALGRTGLGKNYEDFIQTDASINPGNSGGALVNLRGELIGINSAIIGPGGGNVGVGFAIPINMARSVLEQLIAHGGVNRGQLGVMIQDLTPDLASALGLSVTKGALVNQIAPDSPAQKAGMAVGDVITAINGVEITSGGDLRNRVGLLVPNTEVKLTVVRKNQTMGISAVLEAIEAPRSTRPEMPRDQPFLDGVTFGPPRPESGDGEGVLVADVDKNSRAALAGLMADDVIISVNLQPVQSSDEVAALARESIGRLLLQIRRGGGMRFIVIS